jgi:hypothetical protein
MEPIDEISIKPVPEEQINYFDLPQKGFFIDERRHLHKGRRTWNNCLIMGTVQDDVGKTFFLVYSFGEYRLKNVDQISFAVAYPTEYLPNGHAFRLGSVKSTIGGQNQNSFDDLLVSIEARPDSLNLLLAVCSDKEMRDRTIAEYETELDPDIRRYRVGLPKDEPSMRLAIARLVEQEPHLQQRGKAVITVTGANELRDCKQVGEGRSEQEVFFGYLQWTREALQELPFAIVLWVTPELEISISKRAPDFWAWRKGVFRFDS